MVFQHLPGFLQVHLLLSSLRSKGTEDSLTVFTGEGSCLGEKGFQWSSITS